MFHPMTLLRVSLTGAVIWFLLAVLWMGLPSPSFEHSGDSNAYATALLRSEKTLTRVYNVDDYFIRSRRLNRQSFALDYRLDIGDKVLYINDATVNLERSVDADPYEAIHVLVKTGDHDGINPPWFSHADSTLLFWWIHRDTTAMLLQVQSSADGTISVVSGGPQNSNLDDSVVPISKEPLLRLANISPSSHDPIKVVVPSLSQSSSPSRTYQIRLAILTIIAPIGLLVYSLLCALSPAANGLFTILWLLIELVFFYCCFLVLSWIAKGRPPVNDFLATQPIMTIVNRYAGVTPALTSNSGSSSVREDRHFETRRTIHSVADFFRSSAPLDDLLASFDTTRGLTQPMSFRIGATGDHTPIVTTEVLVSEEEGSLEKSDLLEAQAMANLEAGLADPEKNPVG